MKAGIRQGCPLSPIFASVSDFFLRRLQRKLPDTVSRAYADDIAAVIPNMEKVAYKLASTFKNYGLVAGLEVSG